MPISQSQHRTTNHFNGTDADVLLRLRIALSVKRRAGWHLVAITVHNGVVQLGGVVPSLYDRQLIAALVRHLAGVLRIEDNLAVGDPSIRQQVVDADGTPATSDSTKDFVPPPNPFLHLPALTESLDDVLARHAESAVSAI